MTFKKESHTIWDIHHALERLNIPSGGNLQIDVQALKHNALLWREYSRVVEYPHIERTFSDNGEPVYYTNRMPEAEPKGVPEPFMPRGKKK